MSTSCSSLDYLSGLALGSELGVGVGGQAPASVPSLLAPTQAQASALLALSSLPLHLPQMVTKTKKVFVGGVPTSSTVDELREYFTQFGKARIRTCHSLLETHAVDRVLQWFSNWGTRVICDTLTKKL